MRGFQNTEEKNIYIGIDRSTFWQMADVLLKNTVSYRTPAVAASVLMVRSNYWQGQ